MTLALPATGPNTGSFQVALIGLNFIPGAQLCVRFLAADKRQGTQRARGRGNGPLGPSAMRV